MPYFVGHVELVVYALEFLGGTRLVFDMSLVDKTFKCLCVCVCVCEREREREREKVEVI